MSEQLAIGVDVGGTKIAAGLVDAQGVIVTRVREDIADKSPASVVAAIAEAVRKIRSHADADIHHVGVGLPAFLDTPRDIAVVVPNLGWRDVPARALLSDALGCDVALENDANVAAWGEYRFGAGRGVNDLVAVTVGTGVGGGIIIGGRLFVGAQGMAAEIGHMTLVPGGLPCPCGKTGCWEQYASGNALVRIGRELASVVSADATALKDLGDGTVTGITGTHITAAAASGNELALRAFADLADNIAAGLADLVAILDPGAFVIGGGVSEAGDLLMKPLQEAYERRVLVDLQRAIPLKVAVLRNDAGLIGAADLARFNRD
ncbi:MAG: ROK family protein [Actinobacteria bacterium]|jgi:glucokinase|nr:ROK family protein [Actinomycetota bacterium]